VKKWTANFVMVLLATLLALFVFQRLEVPAEREATKASTLTPQQQVIHDDAMQAMNAIKISLQEYYVNTGKWPDSNAVAGLPPPEAFRGKSLRRLDVDGLTVKLTFDAQSGIDGGQVIFTGTATPQLVMGIQWQCASPSFPDIASAISDCTYTRP
jgi:hypothetical protein